MDTNKIEVLLKAVENGSLLTTAGQLGYTQAGLTHMMKSLEADLGVTLLYRGKFGVRLTEEGERLLPLFENLVNANEKLMREAEMIRLQNNSVIRLGTVASVIRTWLPDVISAFQKQYPEYSFEVKEGDFSIYKWFDQGSVDICITCNIVNRRDFEPLMTDEFFACLPPDYPIGEGEVFPLKRFEEESYLSASCGEDYDIQALLDEYDVHPKKQNTRGRGRQRHLHGVPGAGGQPDSQAGVGQQQRGHQSRSPGSSLQAAHRRDTRQAEGHVPRLEAVHQVSERVV